MAEQALWYVVHTYSGYENKVATNLETIVENRRLQDLIQEVKVPVEMVPELKDGKERLVERKLFPGYVLVKMVMTDESWYIVRNCRGVTGFVGPSSKPEPLSDEEAEKLGMNACFSSCATTRRSSSRSTRTTLKRTRSASSSPCSGAKLPPNWNWARRNPCKNERARAAGKTSVRAAKCGFYRVRHSPRPWEGRGFRPAILPQILEVH